MFLHVCYSVHRRQGSLYDVTSWSHVPSAGLCLWPHVPSGGHIPGGLCPGDLFLGGVSLSRVSRVWEGGLCKGDPLTETPPYGKERAVHILLECILVMAVCLVPFFVGPSTFELVGSSVLTSVNCVSGIVCFAVAVSIFLLQTKKKHSRKIDFLNSQLAL